MADITYTFQHFVTLLATVFCCACALSWDFTHYDELKSNWDNCLYPPKELYRDSGHDMFSVCTDTNQEVRVHTLCNIAVKFTHYVCNHFGSSNIGKKSKTTSDFIKTGVALHICKNSTIRVPEGIVAIRGKDCNKVCRKVAKDVCQLLAVFALTDYGALMMASNASYVLEKHPLKSRIEKTNYALSTAPLPFTTSTLPIAFTSSVPISLITTTPFSFTTSTVPFSFTTSTGPFSFTTSTGPLSFTTSTGSLSFTTSTGPLSFITSTGSLSFTTSTVGLPLSFATSTASLLADSSSDNHRTEISLQNLMKLSSIHTLLSEATDIALSNRSSDTLILLSNITVHSTINTQDRVSINPSVTTTHLYSHNLHSEISHTTLSYDVSLSESMLQPTSSAIYRTPLSSKNISTVLENSHHSSEILKTSEGNTFEKSFSTIPATSSNSVKTEYFEYLPHISSRTVLHDSLTPSFYSSSSFHDYPDSSVLIKPSSVPSVTLSSKSGSSTSDKKSVASTENLQTSVISLNPSYTLSVLHQTSSYLSSNHATTPQRTGTQKKEETAIVTEKIGLFGHNTFIVSVILVMLVCACLYVIYHFKHKIVSRCFRNDGKGLYKMIPRHEDTKLA